MEAWHDQSWSVCWISLVSIWSRTYLKQSHTRYINIHTHTRTFMYMCIHRIIITVKVVIAMTKYTYMIIYDHIWSYVYIYNFNPRTHTHIYIYPIHPHISYISFFLPTPIIGDHQRLAGHLHGAAHVQQLRIDLDLRQPLGMSLDGSWAIWLIWLDNPS